MVRFPVVPETPLKAYTAVESQLLGYNAIVNWPISIYIKPLLGSEA